METKEYINEKIEEQIRLTNNAPQKMLNEKYLRNINTLAERIARDKFEKKNQELKVKFDLGDSKR